jgi:hypothetical protein
MSEAALMFSGGVDSTVCVVRLLDEHERVHLLTWDTRGGILRPEWSRRSANVLRDRYGDRIQHHVGLCADEFRTLVTARLARVYVRHRSRFVWCLGCKMAMHIATLAHCLEHGLEVAADGSSMETPYYVEQMPVSIDWLRGFYADHGVTFVTPAHEFPTREEKIRLLDARGLARGRTLFGRNPGTQPLCVPGNLVYFASTFLDRHPRFDVGEVARYLAEDRPLFERLLAARS